MLRTEMVLPHPLEILPPWRIVPDSSDAQRLVAELSFELCANHLLYGLEASAVANRIDRDDVLFEISGGSAPLAVVHLTWQKESDPRWPTTRFFGSWDEWVQHEMLPAHREYGP
jgi:hypothetical protein